MFSSCSALESVTLPDSVQIINDSAFSGCTSLTDINFSDKILSIGTDAFSNCKLPSIHIGADTEYIAPLAFSDCTGTVITIDENNKYYSAEDSVIFNKDKTSLISAAAYPSASYTIPQSVTEISEYAFNNSDISEITFNEGLLKIGKGAFSHSAITELNLPSTLIEINDSAFLSCNFTKNRSSWKS